MKPKGGNMSEKIFELRLDVKTPNIPFVVEKSIAVSSGDLIVVFAQFNLKLIQLLKMLQEDELAEIKEQMYNGPDNIPF